MLLFFGNKLDADCLLKREILGHLCLAWIFFHSNSKTLAYFSYALKLISYAQCALRKNLKNNGQCVMHPTSPCRKFYPFLKKMAKMS